jgi:hypothetical protein
MNLSTTARALLLPIVWLALTAGTCEVTRDITPTTSTNVPTTRAPVDSPSTTVPPTAPPEATTRIDELTAIAAALNVNRLVAIQTGDLEALRAIAGTDEGFSRDRLRANSGGFDFVQEPSLEAIPYEVTEVILDRPDCAVMRTFIDLRAVLGFDETEEQIEVVFFDDGHPSLAGILPLSAPESSWLRLCDEVERTAVPLDPGQ